MSGRTPAHVTSDAVARYKREGGRGLDWEWSFAMTAEEKADFERYLVNVQDPLAYQPGTAEWRFKMYVKAHVPVEWPSARKGDSHAE